MKNSVIALLLIALVGLTATAVVQSQNHTAEVEVRVRAKRLADGRTEFAVEQREGGGWSDSLFARNPRLTAEPVIDRWYRSQGVIASAEVDLAAAAASARPAPPTGWTPLGVTDGEFTIDLEYSVEQDVIDSSLTTIVTTRARIDEYGFERIDLSLVCDDGTLNLVVDDTEFRFSDAPIDVTLRFDDGASETYSWPYFRGAVRGYSPADDREIINHLLSANQVAVRIKSDQSETAALVDLAGFFSTPAQPNIEYCGRSAPDDTVLLSDTRGEIDINLSYSVTANGVDEAPTTVVETWVVNDDFEASRLQLVCDRGRFDAVLNIADGTYLLPSWTQPSFLRIDGGAEEQVRWLYVVGVERGISPDNDAAFLERIRTASTLKVRGNQRTDTVTFGVTGLLGTRAQDNIEFCGQY